MSLPFILGISIKIAVLSKLYQVVIPKGQGKEYRLPNRNIAQMIPKGRYTEKNIPSAPVQFKDESL